jgi:hypothetical protein
MHAPADRHEHQGGRRRSDEWSKVLMFARQERCKLGPNSFAVVEAPCSKLQESSILKVVLFILIAR